MRLTLCLFVLLAACGSGSQDHVCKGTLTFSTDISLGQTHFTMCNNNFPSTGASFDTGEDAKPTSTTGIVLIALGAHASSSTDCTAEVDEPTYKDFQGNTTPMTSGVGGSCTVTTTTYDLGHWTATATGTMVDVRCVSSTSCVQESHAFTASWTFGD